MGLPQEQRQVFQAIVESPSIRYVTLPAAGAGVAMVSDGAAAAWAWAAYVQIAAAVATDPSWLWGALINVGAVETHYGDYAIATGAAAAETDLAIIPYAVSLPGVGGLGTWVPTQGPVALPYPIRIAGTPRMAGRLRKNTAASAAGFTTKACLVTGVGT